MKKIIALLAIPVAALALSACSAGSAEAPKATSTPTTAAPLDREAPRSESLSDNASLTRGESQFLLAIEEYDGIDYAAAEEADIAEAGNIVCEDLAAGYEPLDEAQYLTDELGVSAFEGGFIVGLAANSICPEFSELVANAADAALAGNYA